MTDDAMMLLIHTRQESRNILYCHERNIEAVAEANEACRLVGSINIKGAGQMIRLICHKAYCSSGQTTKADNDILRKLRLYLKEILLVTDWLYDIAYVIRHIRVCRHHIIQFMTNAHHIVRSSENRSIFHIVRRNKAYKLAYCQQRLFIVFA